MIYAFALQFGLRGGAELRNLTIGEGGRMKLVSCNAEEECLLYQEQFSKTFIGGLHEPTITPREAKNENRKNEK